MSIAEDNRDRMTQDEFLMWQTRQDKLYELVDGRPKLPLKMMAGASQRHDRVVINAILSLGVQLKGKPCRPMTSDVAVSIPKGNFRRPDMTIECGKPDNDRTLRATDPRVAMEVLSPSTMEFDRFRKIEEYKTIPDLKVVFLVDTEDALVTVHRREGERWTVEVLEGLDGVIELPEIAARLALRDLYDGVEFPEPIYIKARR